ncbi:hypothetical protein ACQLRR_004210 [Escherichia coli]|uniref:hypothetical protein n=1 Tax=Escherichia coli TaxID=562 RepID=UPI0017902A7B|nr:hypothetical protein [Escherichia coli]EFG9986409.1 hypothetical protein [Escherichia coli]MCN5251141.1 hypothetical protein [Escherichia coli]MCN9011251.1 hypothetical protein [Escherichia coli]
MYLVKSCYSKFNVTNCQTLCIGSLDYYRKTFEEQIADKHEGKIKLTYKLDNFPMSPKLQSITQLFSSKHPHEEAHIGALKFGRDKSLPPDYILMEKYEAEIYLSQKNIFAFCISMSDQPEKPLDILNEYDDFWFFDYKKVNIFAKLVANAIYDEIIKRECAGKSIFATRIDIKKIRVHWKSKAIDYVERELFIDNSTLASMQDDISYVIENPHFIKPLDFSPECEYRFVFEVYSGEELITPMVDQLIIDAKEILKII